MLEGSSIDDSIINKVHNIAKNFKKILIFLDSNHTHDHVLAELNAYANLTSVGSYIVVFDTVIDYLPENHLPNESNPSMSEARTFSLFLKYGFLKKYISLIPLYEMTRSYLLK